MDKSQSARINGQKSHGPATPEGKARSSQNAVKHGLTAQFSVLFNESDSDFKHFRHAYFDRFHPADPVEAELVHTIALSRWRLRRIATLESNLFNNELLLSQQYIPHQISKADDGARLAWLFKRLADSSALPLLMRYESSLTRTHDRALKQLEHLQKSRNEPKPAEPAAETPNLRNEPTTSAPEKGTDDSLPSPRFINQEEPRISGHSGLRNEPTAMRTAPIFLNDSRASTPLRPLLTAPSPQESGTATNTPQSSRVL